MIISCLSLCFIFVGISSSNTRVDAFRGIRLAPYSLKCTKPSHLWLQSNPVSVETSAQLLVQPVVGAEQLSLPSVTASSIFNPLTAVREVLSWQLAAYVLVVGALVAAIRTKLLDSFKSMIVSRLAALLPPDLIRSVRRPFEIGIFALTFAFKYVSSLYVKKNSMIRFIDQLVVQIRAKRLEKTDPDGYKQATKALAKLLTEKLIVLGPTFIKLGQLLSTRIDILPKEYIEELVRLQDKVPGFSGDLAVKIVERELKVPIDKLFDSFDRNSIAAASLGQVHLATKNGQKFAVKVQREGLKELFDLDLKYIRFLAQLVDRLDPKADGTQRDWVSIFDESQRLLYKEIDYQAEARNAIRFKNNFKDVPWVKVPDVYLNMTTSRIVTMEYVPGIKINDIGRIEAAGIDRKVLAKRSAESYLTQLCRHGFFRKSHAHLLLLFVTKPCYLYIDCDPHPGNIACDRACGGRLIYYDFGMMDELTPAVKKGLVDLMFGVYEGDVKEVCDALEGIGVLRSGIDRVSIEKIARVFLQEFAKGIESDTWVSQLSPEEQTRLRRKRRLQLGADLFTLGSDAPFQLPPTFTFVFRAFTSLDGIGKGLDSKYDLVRLARPYLQELMDLRDGSAAVSLLKSWTKRMGLCPVDLQNVVSQPQKVADISTLLQKIEQGDLKIRVRVLESERAFKRMELQSQVMAAALASTLSINAAILLSLWRSSMVFVAESTSSSEGLRHRVLSLLSSWMLRGMVAGGVYFGGMLLPLKLWKQRQFERQLARWEAD